MTRTWLLFFAVTLLITVLPYSSYAYCVYNNMTDDTVVTAVQTAGQARFARNGRRFKKHINPGYKECCPYDDRDCSNLRDQNGDCLINLNVVDTLRLPEHSIALDIIFMIPAMF
ncbi:hypothetical protein BDA99DRAFT_538931 [Phascolomyces articulosus]|uniref:Uncharacterized protein n=1 Tax=Phascolomyces articulosus TaxID=60185 RepID=A0AAD5PEC4_9FUNG|nr:hypothetical protein BDA99DRAFT_538931 [Phascolomyces articulosus]